MNDGYVEALGQVRRIGRRACLARGRGEADLVVRDQVHRAAIRVAGQPVQVERLGHDPLGGEGRIAVDEDWDRDPSVEACHGLGAVGLLGPSPPLDDRVHRLEV